MKVLVTRPRHDASTLTLALAARGIETLLEPLLAIRPVADATQRLQPLLRGAQAVLFTSANGVRAFAAISRARNLPAFAVGHATAAAAREAGFPLVMTAGGAGGDLARLVIDRLRPVDGVLIHAAGRDVAIDLGEVLGAAGFSLRRAVLYEAVAATRLSPACRAALAEHRLDAALFFSPRTAATFVRLVTIAGLGAACRNIAGIAMSAAVAMPLAALFAPELHIAESPTEPALLATLDRVVAAAASPLPPAGRQEASA